MKRKSNFNKKCKSVLRS